MTDMDSYLLKCSLEAIEAGMKAENIQQECACRMGLDVPRSGTDGRNNRNF